MHIAAYLEKFKTIGLLDSQVKNAASLSVARHSGAVLNEKSFSFKNGALKILGSGALKSSVFMFKTLILADIAVIVGENVVRDIR